MNIRVVSTAVLVVLIISTVFSVTWAVKTPRLHEEPQSRIIGGKPAEDGQFPYVVRVLGFGGPWSETHLYSCTGSIIDPRFVLTAGHCYSETTNASEPFTYHIEAGSIISGEPRQFQIVISSHAFLHPEYSLDTLENDIALIKIKPFVFDEYVQPIRIALGSWDSESHVGEKVAVIGFGYISEDGPVSDVLKWTKLTLIAKEVCQAIYTEAENFDLPESVFCAEDQKPPISSACSGDSGGPVVIMIKGKPVEIGVTSFRSDAGCAAHPQGYTDVAKFHDWLTLTMAQNS
ncbi:mite allergen Der f 3-like [Phlebotomus argentipes]|uniref:mite allergen Der f 3-like n=1 Tax=Phlebotomus argentipes TaxID=94469 RepID=UPI00289303F6|nr:mite allergen Der f 3-like [Phlebotomus argentipes]